MVTSFLSVVTAFIAANPHLAYAVVFLLAFRNPSRSSASSFPARPSSWRLALLSQLAR
jgi:hypothetical protein